MKAKTKAETKAETVICNKNELKIKHKKKTHRCLTEQFTSVLTHGENGNYLTAR